MSLKFILLSSDPTMSQPVVQSDRILCQCFQVRESTVRDSVTLLGSTTSKEVRETCGAGGGCMACRQRIQMFIDEIRANGSRNRL